MAGCRRPPPAPLRMITSFTAHSHFRDLLLLTLAFTLLFGLFLGSRPLSVPDEGRYAEIPREMVQSGDWITQRLNGVKYFEKPALVYWLTAVSISIFGLNEWALRLWPALFALAGCLGVYLAGRRFFGRTAGIFAAVVLGTSLLFYAMSRTLILDMAVSILISLALLCFLAGVSESEPRRRKILLYGFYAASALAMLAKGLIGIVIPAMIIGSWILVMNDWKLLRSIHLPTGLVLFFAIAAPWHFLVQSANREFFDFYFIHEHFQRYLTKVHGRFKPFWFFLPILLAGLLPWSAFLIQAVRAALPRSWKERHLHRETVFLLLWAVLVFLFFSASDSKLIPYILPVFPPLAILIGRYFAGAWENGVAPGLRAGFIALGVLASLLIIAAFVAPRFRPEIDKAALFPGIVLLVAIMLAGAATSWILARRYGNRSVLIAVIATTALFLTAANTLMPAVDTRSIKTIAGELKPMLRPGDDVISYHTYYQDLPVYLERRITVVDWTGELAFGTTVEDTSGWMINDADFWHRWQGRGRVYVVTTRKNYDTLLSAKLGPHQVVAGNTLNIVLRNEGGDR